MTFALELHIQGKPASVKVLSYIYTTILGSATKDSENNNAACTRALPPTIPCMHSPFREGREMRVVSSSSVDLQNLLYREIRILQVLTPSILRLRPNRMTRIARWSVRQPRRRPQSTSGHPQMGPSGSRPPFSLTARLKIILRPSRWVHKDDQAVTVGETQRSNFLG